MPQLPFAGFTADPRIGRPTGGGGQPSISDAAPDVQVARAQAQFGGELQNLGATIVRIASERDARNVQVQAAKIGAEFAKELDAAVNTGGDFAEVAQRSMERLDEVGSATTTPSGRQAYELARVRAEGSYSDAITAAEAKRSGLEARENTQTMVNLLGASVTAAPETLDAAKAEMTAYIDSYGNMSPEQKALVVQQSNNDLTVAAANAALRKDPAGLQVALEVGELEDLTPAQRAGFLSRTDSELARRQRGAVAKDEMGKLLTRQALDAEAEDHILTNAEAPEWFEKGVTAAQFQTAQAKSIDAAEARAKLDRDVRVMAAGGGATLNNPDYEAALTAITAAATEGMDPQAAAQASTGIRVEMATFNGRQDAQLKSILNAGPTGGAATFEAGLSLRDTLADQSPELLSKMIDGKSQAWYNAYDFMVEELGIDPETARGRLFETEENRKDTEARLNSKENRELIEDAVDVDFEGQNIMVQRQIKERAAFYMALVPTMTAERAVEISSEDFETSTVEINQGIRAKATGVPVRWEPADRYVRHVALERDLKAANAPVPADELDDLTFFPNGDGTVAVIGLDGLTIFPRWNWQAAVDEWWVEIGQADVAIASKKRVEAAAKKKEFESTPTTAELGLLGF